MSEIAGLVASTSERSRRSSFSRHRAGVVSGGVIVAVVVVALIGPWVVPADPNAQDLHAVLQPPSWDHPFGTDRFGRDLLARLVVGSRTSLIASAIGVSVGIIFGLPAGLIAGHTRGAFDALASRLADATLAMPPLILAIGVVAMLGSGLTNAMIAVGIVLAPRFYRVARGATLSIAGETYIEAALADGCTTRRILQRHVLPNASGPLLVQISIGVGTVIAAEAGLSFLGIGAQPPQSSWGTMTREGFDVLSRSSWSLVPSTVLTIVVITAFFVVGDSVRDAVSGAPTR